MEEVLKATGVELELHVFRAVDHIFTCYLQTVSGTAVDLSNASPQGGSDVVFSVVERLGGPLRYVQVNSPTQHADAVNGVTRFSLPATVTAGLTGLRSYTWKYQVVRRIVLTGQHHVWFHGDLRVLTAPAPIALSVLQQTPGADVLAITEDVTAVLV